MRLRRGACSGSNVTFNSSGYPLADTLALGMPEAQQTTYVRNVPSLPNGNL